MASALQDAAAGAGMGATLGTIVPGIGNVVGGVIGGVGGLLSGIGGDPHKVQERDALIQQLEQGAEQGNTGDLDTLESWATGGKLGGVESRSDEPNASRQVASQALQSLGYNVPAVTTSGGSSGSGSAVPAIGGALGAAGAIAGGSGNSSLGNALTSASGTLTAAGEYQQQQQLYNQALQQANANYAGGQTLIGQGENAVENAMASPPNLSAAMAAPSSPFSRSAPVSGTPVPGISTPAPATAPAATPIPAAPMATAVAP